MPADPCRDHAWDTAATAPDTILTGGKSGCHHTHNRRHRRCADHALRARMIIRPWLQIDLFPNSLQPIFTSQVQASDEICPRTLVRSDGLVDKLAIQSARDVAFRCELNQQIIDGEPRRRFNISNDSTMAAPNVIFRLT